MRKCYLLSLICTVVIGMSTTVDAQKKVTRLDYDMYSKQVKAEVWGWDRPEFNNRTIPAEYADASAVVIAMHHEIGLNAKKRLVSTGNSLKSNHVLYYTNTIRRMVKLNDKSSIEKHSEFSFQQYIAGGGYYTEAAAMTVVGVRIIKPDGTMKEIDASDEVEMEGTRKDRSRKLAIADLQVGDIIDYFVHYTEQMDYKNIDPLTFVLAGSNPILSYSIHASIDKRLTTEYRAINGAPDFAVVKDDGEFDLSAKLVNIAPLANERWISAGRQLPVISLSIYYKGSKNLYHPPSARKAGVHKNVDYQQIISDYKWELYSSGYRATRDRDFEWIDGIVQKYKKARPGVSSDSLACLIYYVLQHNRLNGWDAKNVAVDNERNGNRVKPFGFVPRFCCFLVHYGIKSDIIFAPSAFGPSIHNISNIGDLDVFVSTQSAHPVLFARPSPFTDANIISSDCEGQEAVLFHANNYKKSNFKATGKDEKITLPLSAAASNKRNVEMQVSMDMGNPLELQFDRTTTVGGHLEENYQQLLLLYENYEALNRSAFSIGKSMYDEMASNRHIKTLAQEYEAAFAEAREKQKDYFKQEINMEHDVDAKDVKEFAVINAGMPVQKSDLAYRVKYTMDGFVHKAGNNYTIDIGKLIGTQLRLEPKERNRSMDVYMPYARTYVSNISFTIPDGYTAEGLDAIKYQVNNPFGKFMVTTALTGKTLQVNITKEYSQAFVPVAHWPQLLEIIDGANDFYGKSIMLRKANTKK